MARLILSAGMFSDFAARIAVRSLGFMSGSPPLLAAMAISLIRRVKILPRLASSAPFLCLIVAHLEWPDMVNPQWLSALIFVGFDRRSMNSGSQLSLSFRASPGVFYRDESRNLYPCSARCCYEILFNNRQRISIELKL